MNIEKKKDLMILLIAVLWLAIAVLGWKGMYMPGLYLSVVLMFLHIVLGASVNGKISKKFLFYPVGIWAVLWVISFYLSDHYAEVYAGVIPDFTILGFHPSFAWTVLTYWIGGVLTLTLGFVLYKDEWLSDKAWDDFISKVKKIDDKNQERGAV